VGLAIAFIYLQTRRRNQRVWQVALVGGVALLLVVITVLAYQLKIVPFIMSLYGQ
jgi:multisubunit Na+/H+ antiporter MnhB subunit